MQRSLNVYFSNRIERLFEELKLSLFEDTDPFTKRFIIVPSPAMKTWLMINMAKDKELRIAGGVKITTLEVGFRDWIATLSINTDFPKKISELELSLTLEVYIKKIAANYSMLPHEDKELWRPLLFYLLGTDEVPEGMRLKKREQRKILALASKLANLFAIYAKYGRGMLKKWKNSKTDEWQIALWKMCINEVFPDKCEWKKDNVAIHLFGISFLSELDYELLLSLSKTIPANYYLLSPCHLFWSDILSDRECKNFIRYWEGKKIPETNREALEALLYDKNSLLANLARVGREMARQIEGSHVLTKEIYEIPKSLLEQERYMKLASCDLLTSDTDKNLTLLDSLQGDLLFMRNPAFDLKLNFEKDSSIQLLAACTPMREVQIVYDTILSIIHKHNSSQEKVYPEDVIVMAPDIIVYEPFIKAVFSQNEVDLNYQMSDLNISLREPEIRGLLQLIHLAGSRWEVSSVLQLFENPSFQEKHRISLDDMLKIETWVRSADVRWGKDPSHRKEALERDLEESCRIDPNPAGTWKQATDRLLLGMAMCVSEENDTRELSTIPIDTIEASEAPLFGRWMKLMRSLSSDLEILSNGSVMTLKEWSLYIKCLLECYLVIEETPACRRLFDFLQEFSLGKETHEEAFSFLTIQYHLEAFLQKERSEYREVNLHAIRFCSMLPMRALPAKVIILMGMNEGNYPRTDGSDTLNLLKNEKEKDYCPTRPDFDRYLFLETILSARNYYLISYCTHSKEDGKELAPSLLVSELLAYLDGGYTIDGQPVSKTIHKTFPFNPYDKKLFENDSILSSYSEMYYRASLARYNKKNELPKHSFLKNFSSASVSPSNEVTFLNLKQLERFAKDPIGAYFRETLGIFLKDEEDSLKNDEENFVISNLEKYFINKNSIRYSLEHTLELAEKKGILPVGPFREYSIQNAVQDALQLIKHMRRSNVSSTQIFKIKFSETERKPFLSENGDWHLPPIVCAYGNSQIKIIGELSDISSSGMLSIKEAKAEKIVELWPQYLVFCCLIRKYALPIEGNLLFLKDGQTKVPFFEDPFPLLEQFVSYYFHSLINPSPLIPVWIPEILENDPQKFQVKIRQSLDAGNQYFFNNCFKWMARDSTLPDSDIILKEWNQMARTIFGEVFRYWGGGKKGAVEEVEG